MISRLIERVAARFGFCRFAPAPTELIVFSSYEAARQAGFRGSSHPANPSIRAWWPGQGPAGLVVRPIQRVTISRDMRHVRTTEGPLEAILRAKQRAWGERALWIEL